MVGACIVFSIERYLEASVQVFFGIGYFVVGIVQLFAIMDGIGSWLGAGAFASFLIALFVTYIPLAGSALGTYGAVDVWNWELWQALLLFFWYVPIFIVLFVASVFER